MSQTLDFIPNFDYGAGTRYRDALREEAQYDEGVRLGLVEPRKTPAFSDVLGAAYRQEWLVAGVWDSYQRNSLPADPSYTLDDAEYTRLTADIPAEHQRAFAAARSREHATEIRNTILRELEDKKTLDEAGGMGVAATIGAAVTDPVQLIVSAAIGPAAALGHGGKLARFVKGGLAAGGVNAGAEVVLGASQYTRDPSQVASAALFGFALGGLAGILSKAEIDEVRRLGNEGSDAATASVVRGAGYDVMDGVAVSRRHSMPDPAVPQGLKSAEAAMAAARARTAGQRLVQEIGDTPVTAAERSQIDELLATSVREPKKAPSVMANAMEEARVNRLARLEAEHFAAQKAAQQSAKEAAFEAAEHQKRIDTELAYAQREAQAAHELDEDGNFLHGSVGAAQVKPVEKESTAFKWLRWDIFARINRSSNDEARQLGLYVFDDAVGSSAKGVKRGISATGFASMMHKAHAGEALSRMNDSFASHAKVHGVTVGDRIRGTAARNFYARVTRAVRGGMETDADVLAAAKAFREMHASLLDEAQRLGVHGVEDIKASDFYAMRRFNHDSMDNLASRFHKDEIIRLIKGAMKAAKRDEPLTEARATLLAHGYWRALRKLRHEPHLHHFAPTSKDYGLLRKALLDTGDVAEENVDEVITMITGVAREAQADATKIARFKTRVALDETFKLELKGKDGAVETVGIDALFENDARALSMLYSRQLSGQIGFAKVGIKSGADWDAAIKRVTDHAVDKGLSSKETNDLVKMFEMGRKHAFGIPLEDEPMGTGHRWLRGFRNYNFANMMGQVGAAQLADIGNLLGAGGFRQFWKAMPELRVVGRALAGKTADDPLHRQILGLIGAGGDAASTHTIMREVFDGEFYRPLTFAERALERSREFVSKVSGLESINLVMKQQGEILFLNHFSDLARGVTKIDDKLMHRLATDGIDEANIDVLFKQFKKYSSIGPDGNITAFDWTGWRKADPDSLDEFRMALFRQVNRAIQEPTIGETATWMHSSLGKVLTQFRSFMLTSWAKQSLHGLNHFDQRTIAQWAWGTVLAGTAYTAQNALNFAGNPEELERRLDPMNITASAFARSPHSSIFPAVIDTALWMAGADPAFGFARSSGNPSNLLTGSPVVANFTKISGTLRAISRSALDDDHAWTRSEAKNALGMVTPNTWLIRNFVDGLASDFPKNNPLEPYQPQSK